ncbi:MAG: hypothetical protein WA662_06755, partial [Pseudolabrys sp.]
MRVTFIGNEIIDREQRGFQNDEAGQTTQEPEKYGSKGQQKRSACDVGQDFGAALETVLISCKVSHRHLHFDPLHFTNTTNAARSFM